MALLRRYGESRAGSAKKLVADVALGQADVGNCDVPDLIDTDDEDDGCDDPPCTYFHFCSTADSGFSTDFIVDPVADPHHASSSSGDAPSVDPAQVPPATHGAVPSVVPPPDAVPECLASKADADSADLSRINKARGPKLS